MVIVQTSYHHAAIRNLLCTCTESLVGIKVLSSCKRLAGASHSQHFSFTLTDYPWQCLPWDLPELPMYGQSDWKEAVTDSPHASKMFTPLPLGVRGERSHPPVTGYFHWSGCETKQHHVIEFSESWSHTVILWPEIFYYMVNRVSLGQCLTTKLPEDQGAAWSKVCYSVGDSLFWVSTEPVLQYCVNYFQ